MSMLRSLERVAMGQHDGVHHPVSPKLTDETQLRTWVSRVMENGTKEDKERALTALHSDEVVKTLKSYGIVYMNGM